MSQEKSSWGDEEIEFGTHIFENLRREEADQQLLFLRMFDKRNERNFNSAKNTRKIIFPKLTGV
jgi:hypothetical protein